MHVLTVYSLDITPPLPFLLIRFSFKYGEAYNWIMVISLVYMPPFLAVEHARETALAELSRAACDEARSGLVLQGKESWNYHNEGAECVRSENAMQFSHHHEPAAAKPIAWSVYRWPVGS